MNKLYVFLGLLFLSVAGIACNNRQSTTVEDNSSEQQEVVGEEEEMFFHQPPDIAFQAMDDVMDNVSLHMEKQVYDSVPHSFRVLVLNDSGWDITTGSDYRISKLVADEWVEFDMAGIGFDRMIHPIKERGHEQFIVDLFTEQFKYPVGTYRIQKFFQFELGTFDQEVEFSISQ